MIDSDQRLDSNRRLSVKLASTDVIISNHDPILKGDLWPIYCLGLGLGHTSVTSFEKVRNGHRFENRTTIWEFEKGHRFENWKSIWEFEKRT